jgi:hypothetical protein
MALWLAGASLPALAQITPQEAGTVAPSFPQFPPSRACEAADLLGVWQIVRIYQSPPGQDLSSTERFPFQYILFHPNSLVHRTWHAAVPDQKERIISYFWDLKFMWDIREDQLYQYTLQEGRVYFYNNGEIKNQLMCFIVSTEGNGFVPGQMLLLEPENPQQRKKAYVCNKLYGPEKR